MSPSLGFGVTSRRRFLKVSLGAGAAVLMGGSGSILALRGRAPAVEGLRCLSAHEYRTTTALARVLYPQGGAFAFGAADCDLARQVDAFLADAAPWDQSDVRRAMVLLEFGPLLFDRRFTTFSRLPDDQRLAHFESWTVSDGVLRRQIASAFRRLLALTFFDRPEVWPSVGYEGPLIHKVTA